MFYEDETGLRLDFCTDPVNCFFEIPQPGLPVAFPTNYPDEAFYWAADSIMIEPGNVKAILVMAREAAFFNDAVAPGDQVVFSRIRLFIDGAPQMVGNTYTVTTPYRTFSFVSEPGDAGPGSKGEGFSNTLDIGLSAPLEFNGAMIEFPTFLIPASLDRATLINSPGALFLTPAGGTQVTGSPTGNNFFRIEGAEIGTVYPSYLCADAALGGVKDAAGADVLTDCVELDLFTMSGRVAGRHGVEIDKTVYEKVDTDPGAFVEPLTYVNVSAHSVEAQALVVEVDGGMQVGMTEGVDGHYFARLQEGIDYTLLTTGGKPLVARVTNLTDIPSETKTSEITDEVVITQSLLDTSAGMLQVTAQSSNRIDPSSLSIDPAASSQPLAGFLTDTGLGSAEGSFPIGTATEIGVPPQQLGVVSADGGSAVRDVEVVGRVTNGGLVALLAANAGPDQSVLAGTIVEFSGVDSAGQIATYQWDSTSTLPFSCINASCSRISVPTPVDNQGLDKLVADFTLTVFDGVSATGASSSDSAQLTVTNPVVQVPDLCTIASAEYREGKEHWRVSGSSDVADNQLIDVYVGSIAFDFVTSRLLGSTRVDALGGWDLRTPRDSAVAAGQEPGSDTLVWIQSERGCQETSNFITK